MARTKKGPSKSQAIRDFMRKNKGASVQQIADGLKSEGVTAALVYNVQSSLRLKKSAKRAAKKTAAEKTAAPSNGSAETSKAERIRQVAQNMGGRVRPRDVIATLAAEGVTVTSAQVSTTLRAMGMRRRRRGRKPGATAGRPAAPVIEMLTLENLLAAKKLVNQLGSIETAKAAVDALVRLS